MKKFNNYKKNKPASVNRTQRPNRKPKPSYGLKAVLTPTLHAMERSKSRKISIPLAINLENPNLKFSSLKLENGQVAFNVHLPLPPKKDYVVYKTLAVVVSGSIKNLKVNTVMLKHQEDVADAINLEELRTVLRDKYKYGV